MIPRSAETTKPASDYFDNWTLQVRKGVLELRILNALAERERYGPQTWALLLLGAVVMLLARVKRLRFAGVPR